MGNDDTSLCDRVLLYNNGFIAYNKDSTGAWVQDGELDDVTDTLVIAPGTGALVQRRSGTATTITQTGQVRSNKFARPFAQGYQLIAPAYPVGISPNYLGANSSANWGVNDKIIPFSSGFVSYDFDPADTSGGAYGTWVESGQLDPANSLTLISSDGVGFVYRSINDVGILETSPVQ